jgi:hypothetical protein
MVNLLRTRRVDRHNDCLPGQPSLEPRAGLYHRLQGTLLFALVWSVPDFIDTDLGCLIG